MMIDPTRLQRAYETARRDLLAERTPDGHWVGYLSSSALSTATACSALALMCRAASSAESTSATGCLSASAVAKWRSLIDRGIAYLARSQNPDGGFGDTDKSLSNIATTLLVEAAIHLAGAAEAHAELLKRAHEYVDRTGGIPALRRRYGIDKTFSVPILTNCALAGLVPWSEVSALPFELACLPQSWYRLARMPVVSYAIPALVAIGQAKFFHAPPWFWPLRLLRRASVGRSLRVLQAMQPASGGYLEATPLTSFVVMSLAAIGRGDHPVAQHGTRFLVESIRDDGSWPIDTNLATWVTTQAINALGNRYGVEHLTPQLLDWLLGCQHRERHPFTGADPGGWGWSDLSGAVPDADDTPGALIALLGWPSSDNAPRLGDFFSGQSIAHTWLLRLQNHDGGWPTFCRGWGKLPFDRSGTDLTAHAMRSLYPWSDDPQTDLFAIQVSDDIDRAMKRGERFLARTQRPNGAWAPLWFGNQYAPDEENLVYGTAKVLFAYRDLKLMDSEPARRGLQFLAGCQNPDGGWGGAGVGLPASCYGKATLDACGLASNAPDPARPNPFSSPPAPHPSRLSSVEETALAVEALLATADNPAMQQPLAKGLNWLVTAVENNSYREPSPIGLYFAKLWYYERLYPIIFTVSALRHAVEKYGSITQAQG